MVPLLCIVFSLIVIKAGVLNEIGRVYIPDIADPGFPGAENVVIAPDANRIFAADGASIGVNVISFNITDENNDDANMEFEQLIPLKSVFEDFNITNDIQNITVHDVTSLNYASSIDHIIACIVPNDYAIEPNYGWLAFIEPYDLTISELIQLPQCYLPDHVTTTNNGDTLVISCEGEPDDNEEEFPEYNPPGSVQIIDLFGSTNSSLWNNINIGFTDFDSNGNKSNLLPDDTYLPYINEPFSINAEPEYGTCTDDSKYCFICLQEQNVIAVLDMDSREFINIFSLGTNDYSVYGLDASDRDNMINIATYPNLYGLRMPDAIDYFKSVNGREYIFTANEGDSKDFDESRVSTLRLDNTAFDGHNISELQLLENLGRLEVTNLWGLSETNNNTYSELYAFSSRDFTVFEVIRNEDGEFENEAFIYSNNNDFEEISAEILGEPGFNANHHNPSGDTRSDDKGPEPESIAIGTCNNGRSFVFIGMERVSGIFVYDITDIDNGNVRYIEYLNNRDFTLEYPSGTRTPEQAGDVGPEQLRFIGEDVFGGYPLLVVANAESSSVTMYRIDCEAGIIEDEEDESGLSDGEIVVIVLASVIGAILLVGLCVYCMRRRREKGGNDGISTDMTKLTGNDKTKYDALE